MKKIIVADDEATSMRLLAEAVREEGFVTICASTGRRVWDLLSDNDDIAAIVTDMMMPELSGEELIALARGSKRYRDIPIIMVSGVVSLNDISHILEIGATRFLPKPVNLQHLREYLRTLVKK